MKWMKNLKNICYWLGHIFNSIIAGHIVNIIIAETIWKASRPPRQATSEARVPLMGSGYRGGSHKLHVSGVWYSVFRRR